MQPGHRVAATLADKKGLPQMERKMTAEPLIQQKCQTPLQCCFWQNYDEFPLDLRLPISL